MLWQLEQTKILGFPVHQFLLSKAVHPVTVSRATEILFLVISILMKFMLLNEYILDITKYFTFINPFEFTTAL